MNPPARFFFNVLQMNSTEKRFRYSSMNRIISDVLGRVPTRKKLRQPLKVHWCRVALDFHGEASRFRRPDLQARVLGCFPHGGPVGSIDGLCAMTPPALGLLPGTRLASTYFPPRCGPLQDGPHDPSHPGQIFWCCCNLGREPRKLRFYCVINAMCLCCQAVSNTRLTITASGFG